MSITNSKEFKQLLERTKLLEASLEATRKQVAEMKRKVDDGHVDEDVAKAKAANVKLEYRISHLKNNLEEELEKDRRYVYMGR